MRLTLCGNVHLESKQNNGSISGVFLYMLTEVSNGSFNSITFILNKYVESLRCLITLLGFMICSIPCISGTVATGGSTSGGFFSKDSLYDHISQERCADLVCRFMYMQNSNTIQRELGANAFELERLSAFVREALDYPGLSISRVSLTGYSSIEGDYAHNEVLSRERVEHFYTYLCERFPELYRFPHDMAWVAEDWKGLSDRVKVSSINEREEILDIIRNVRIFDDREVLLMRLNGGHAYRLLETDFFPWLRRVELRIEYKNLPADKAPTASDPIIYNVLDEKESDFRHNRSLALAREKNMIYDWKCKARSNTSDYRFALKTNALLWAGILPDLKHTAPVVNAALEYRFSNHWSAELSGMYSYWYFNSRREFQGISGYGLEPRYRYILPGNVMEIYGGIYGRIGDYDKRTPYELPEEEKAAMDNDTDNYTGEYWDAGVSAGLHLRLLGNWGLEVGARVGYLKTKAIRYIMDGKYNWYESEHPYGRLRMTGLNLNLVYRFK